MKIRLLLFIIFNLPFVLLAQSDLKKEVTTVNDSLFQIIESNEKGQIIISGYLSSVEPEVRHGEFNFYNRKGNLEAKGFYDNDMPIGNWKYFNRKGKIINEIDYEKVNKFLREDVSIPEEEIYIIVENMPSFVNGGLLGFNKYIASNLVYPIYALKKGISGKVFVTFIVNTDGKIVGLKVQRSNKGLPFEDLQIEALRVISECPSWNPGTQNGKKVNVIFTHPIVFVLKPSR